MNNSQEMYNQLSKLRSIMLDIADTGQLKQEHLNDFNDSMGVAFDALEGMRSDLRKAWSERKEAVRARTSAQYKTQRLETLLELLGLSKKGVEELGALPVGFLKASIAALDRSEHGISGELHIHILLQQYRWAMSMVERDRHNFHMAGVQKQLHAKGTGPVKRLALEILENIAEESGHLIEGLRNSYSFDKVEKQSREHWYNEIKNIAIAE